MIRLLMDQAQARSTVEHLSVKGCGAVHVADIGQSRASDAEIVAMASAERRAIVALDSDFHRLRAITGASRPSVIRIRREGLRGAEIAALVQQLITRLHRAIEQGAMITVTERAARVRRLRLRSTGSSRSERPRQPD